jgi:hypothetical protein
MTTLITYLSPVFQTQALTEAQVTAFSMVVIGLLFVLLVQKEFIRAYGIETIRIWLDTFNIFAWSLLAVFAYLIAMRFLGFIIN